MSGKIRRVELRSAEAARGGENRRVEGEFWEEDFTELAGTAELSCDGDQDCGDDGD
jgi:hypothetical protein